MFLEMTVWTDRAESELYVDESTQMEDARQDCLAYNKGQNFNFAQKFGQLKTAEKKLDGSKSDLNSQGI